ncbi:hypothetical protein [Microbacterium rhizosphaerae]|uniref:Uncharacterized protein n=1 Tax=Microbacterium rhizosphaerae TaxID=1678237 RepID=A0ABZ0SLA5_9MICO|nr:hypothetical protein [Microbacterium rhizosphaerae]WPR90164.1 hypothetical protein SM116_02430 [Microbacterium rhizosphaerae]
MTATATVFVLIGGIALTTSIATRYGQALSELAGLSSPSSPLRGDWGLSQRAPVGPLKWSFSRVEWREQARSGTGDRVFQDAADNCMLFLNVRGVGSILPVFRADDLDSEGSLLGAERGLSRGGATIAHEGSTRDGWVAVDEGKVELAAATLDFTPRGSKQPITQYIYVRKFNASHQLASMIIDCPKGTFETAPTLLSDAVHAASLVHE